MVQKFFSRFMLGAMRLKMMIFKEGNSLCRVAISGKKKKKKQKLFFQMLDPDNYKAVHLLGLLGKTGLVYADCKF